MNNARKITMPLDGAVVQEKKRGYLFVFEAQNHYFEFVMRELWMKLLRGESEERGEYVDSAFYFE